MKKILFSILILVFIAGGFFVWKIFNEKPQTACEQKADFQITAEKLFSDFESEETKATKKYLRKIIEVKGKVAEIKKTETNYSVILKAGDFMGGINCSFSQENFSEKIKKGQEIKLKGYCNGMTLDVVLNRCCVK